MIRPRLALRVVAQHLDIGFGGLAFGLGGLIGDIGQIGGVDDHVDAVELAEFAQLQSGERRLQWTASADHHHLLDAALTQRIECVIGDIGLGQHVGIGDQNAGHVHGDVAVADHHGAAG